MNRTERILISNQHKDYACPSKKHTWVHRRAAVQTANGTDIQEIDQSKTLRPLLEDSFNRSTPAATAAAAAAAAAVRQINLWNIRDKDYEVVLRLLSMPLARELLGHKVIRMRVLRSYCWYVIYRDVHKLHNVAVTPAPRV